MTSNPADVQDIVRRLRGLDYYGPLSGVADEAADEIERLRAALQQSRSAEREAVFQECATAIARLSKLGHPYPYALALNDAVEAIRDIDDPASPQESADEG